MWTLLLEKKGFFLDLLVEHIEISLLAIVIAIVIGGGAGILISEYQKASKPTLGVINFLYTIPSISMLGFLIPFSGVGNATAVIALTVYALLPMVRNTNTGLTNVDENILEAAKGMGSTKTQILFKVKLPLAMPVIISGIRNMVTMTMAGSLLIALLALAFDFVLGFVERRLSKRSIKAKKTNRIMAAVCVALILIFALIQVVPKNKKETIHIATKPMTEQYILGEMLDILIEQDTDLDVEITQGVGGGTSNIQPAMESGEFDIYPEYTGTAWNMVLDGLYTEDMFTELESEYEDSLGMSWVGMYGFNNTYGLVVRKEIVDKYNIKTYSDLRAVSDKLIFGAEYDFFEREDGYDALCSEYGFNFKKTMDMDLGLKYQAINQGKIDVMNIFTTDGQLAASDVTVLVDDKNFYPSYMCGNVVRNEVIESHPEIKDVLDELSGTITDSDMAQMNYDVETEGREPRDVAEEFLSGKGLLK